MKSFLKFKKLPYIFILYTIVYLSLNLFIFYTTNTDSDRIISPECKCFEDIFIQKLSDSNYSIKSGKKTYLANSKSVLTCDLYKSLKRGPNQRIVSYSLYGKEKRYYNLIPNLTQLIKKFYPDHVMRIYHDNSIDKSIICKFECANEHVEFCDIHKIPKDIENSQDVLNMDYIHSMMWRFLPIGDTFVDLFMSRDLDSLILQREVDSVQEWVKSDNVGHIMRDNPYHAAAILGGMWGLKTHLDRLRSKFIFNQIVDKKFSKKFNPNSKSPKGFDQVFLETSVYHYITNSSLEHDSYFCNFFPTSKPFPTRRIGNCFVGCIGSCNQSAAFYPCPIECRPKNHSNWSNC